MCRHSLRRCAYAVCLQNQFVTPISRIPNHTAMNGKRAVVVKSSTFENDKTICDVEI